MYFALAWPYVLLPLVGIGALLAVWVAARSSERIRRRLRLIVLLVILGMFTAALLEVVFIDPTTVR